MPEIVSNRFRNTGFQDLAGEGDGGRLAKPTRASLRPPHEPSRKSKKPSGTAFADLVDDMPGLFEEPEAVEEPRPQAEIPAGSAVLSADMRDRLNSRVLGESGYQQKPYWWNSLLLGGLSLAFLYSWNQTGGYEALVPGVLGISIIGGLYSIRGAVKSSDGKARALCVLGLLLTLVAAVGVL